MSPVCGKYGTATNVWGIGCIMYEAACLTGDEPEPYLPFLPNYPIRKLPAKGTVFGTLLRSQDLYSDELKDLIQECLYEQPGHRPSLIELKTHVTRALKKLVGTLNTPSEPWGDLDRPEPMTAYVVLFIPVFVPTSPVQRSHLVRCVGSQKLAHLAPLLFFDNDCYL